MREIIFYLLTTFGPLLVLLLIGVTFGTMAQRRHIAELKHREAALGDMLLTNVCWHEATQSHLVTGSTVVAYDFFRRISVMIRKLFGGHIPMHSTLMMRARREAILRMAEAARAQGANSVHNIRLVSANLGHNGSAFGGCEILAYGTAIWD